MYIVLSLNDQGYQQIPFTCSKKATIKLVLNFYSVAQSNVIMLPLDTLIRTGAGSASTGCKPAAADK